MSINDKQPNKYGFITSVIEKLFRVLQFIPPQFFLNNRSDFNNSIEYLSEEDFKKATQKRSKKVEIFICAYIVFEIVLIFLIAYGCISKNGNNSIIYYPALLFCLFRYVNIVEVSVNMTLFDSSRSRSTHVTASYVRSLVLLLLNYIELAILFGITYSILPWESIEKINYWTDNFYFSFITQLTIGYGDLHPIGAIKLLSVIQGLTTFYFTILIIGRFIGLMPKITELEKKNKNDQKTE